MFSRPDGCESRKDLQARRRPRGHAAQRAHLRRPAGALQRAGALRLDVPQLHLRRPTPATRRRTCGRTRSSPRSRWRTCAHKYHLDEPVVVRYWYWLQDVFTHKLGSSLVTSQPIWPDIQRTLGAHGASRAARGDLRARTRGRRRDAVGRSSVLGLRLLLHDAELHRACHARLLARAAPADRVRRHLPEVARADLLHVRPEQHRLGDLVARPDSAHRTSGDDDLPRQLRALQPLHACSDARRHQLGLRAHRARERRVAGEGDHPATLRATRSFR